MEVGAVNADTAAGRGGGGEEGSEAEGFDERSETSEGDGVAEFDPKPTESAPLMASLAPATSGPPPMPGAGAAGMLPRGRRPAPR